MLSSPLPLAIPDIVDLSKPLAFFRMQRDPWCRRTHNFTFKEELRDTIDLSTELPHPLKSWELPNADARNAQLLTPDKCHFLDFL